MLTVFHDGHAYLAIDTRPSIALANNVAAVRAFGTICRARFSIYRSGTMLLFHALLGTWAHSFNALLMKNLCGFFFGAIEA